MMDKRARDLAVCEGVPLALLLQDEAGWKWALEAPSHPSIFVTSAEGYRQLIRHYLATSQGRFVGWPLGKLYRLLRGF